MSIPNRVVAALAGATLAGLSGLVSAAPAEAAPQQALLSVYGPIHENVTFVAAGFTSPIKVGRRVELQVKSGSRWKIVDTVKQDQYGGLSFSARLGRTSKAKDSKGYEWRYFRMRARAAGGLKEKVSSAKKVKPMLDPKVYYRVVRASVQHTGDATRVMNGCDVVTSMSGTRKTSSALGKAESGKPRWKAKRLANGTISAEVDPGLTTTWTQDLKGCRYAPAPAACQVTKVDKPTGDGKERLGVRILRAQEGSGSAMFYTRGVDIGHPSADDSVCNVPWMRSGDVPVKIRTKTVSRSTLLGKKPFTIVNQGQTSWTRTPSAARLPTSSCGGPSRSPCSGVDKAGRRLK
ncbi:hypothetical protein [Aeromicrobium sp. UC242_57]|uniref:hypothetical protein n=1 Tax=Aeromicrobium sp. UC242_57 TaxID=3374624 RepID=UPI0037B71673